jgi:glycosyltransferase involved in cell wall biosynthesis
MIVHVIDNLLPEMGGPTSVVIELARHQALAGERVAVVCRVGPREQAARAALDRSWAGTGVEFVEVPSDAAGQRGALASALDRLRPRVVHLHCVWERILRVASSEAARRGIPRVTSTHGMLHPYALGQKRLKKLAYLTLFRRHFLRAGEFLSLNTEETAYIRGRLGWESSVLCNGVELDRYGSVDGGDLRRALPALGDRPFALFIGRLHPIKGCDLLLRSFSILRKSGHDLHLVFVGPDSGVLGELRAQSEAAGIAGSVHFPGGLFGTEKLSALSGCSLFVHRPRFEGFGIAVIEGMASRRPVVTTANCHLEPAAAAGAILVAPDTDEGFAEGMASVLRAPSLALGLGERGRAWVEANCSWPSIVGTADACYRRART